MLIALIPVVPFLCHASFALLDSLFIPEDGHTRFVQNGGNLKLICVFKLKKEYKSIHKVRNRAYYFHTDFIYYKF